MTTTNSCDMIFDRIIFIRRYKKEETDEETDINLDTAAKKIVLDDTAKTDVNDAKDVGEQSSTTAGKFRVTVTGDEPEVAFIENGNSTKVVIPDIVTVDGVTYNVTSIASGAFKNSKKIRSVTIGKNIDEIASGAFSGCTSLTKE